MRYVYKENEEECALIIKGMVTPVHSLIRVDGEWKDPVQKEQEEYAEQLEIETITYENELDDMPLHELNLPTRALNALLKNGVATVGQLVKHSADDLRTFRNLGESTLRNIITVLDSNGLCLRESTLVDDCVDFLSYNEDGTYSIKKVRRENLE